jgi:hypothetical protein
LENVEAERMAICVLVETKKADRGNKQPDLNSAIKTSSNSKNR